MEDKVVHKRRIEEVRRKSHKLQEVWWGVKGGMCNRASVGGTEWWHGTCRPRNWGHPRLSKGANRNEASKTVGGKGDKHIGKFLGGGRGTDGLLPYREVTPRRVTEVNKHGCLVFMLSKIKSHR